MAPEEQTTRETVLDQIERARRQSMMRYGVECEQKEHYSEAIDLYRQLIADYYGTTEEEEAKERMLDLAYLFETKGEAYRAKALYGLLEQLYEREGYDEWEDKRKARVKEILSGIYADKQAEAEREAKLEEAG